VPELSLFVINYRHLIWIAAFKGLTCDSAKDMDMAIKTGHQYEISDDFVNALRNTYTRGKTDKISICDKSETAMAYALNELGVVESSQIGQHLRSCRDCLALVLDIRLSLEEAAGRRKASTDLDAEISTALAPSKASESVSAPTNRFHPVRSKFISYFLSPKLIAGLAACCIVFFILTTLPIEKDAGEDTDLIRKKITQPAGKQKPATKIYKLKLNRDDSKKIETKVKPGKKIKSPLVTPLEKIELKYLKLLGVMLSDSGNIAIIKDPNGKEYIISEGERIGVNSGQVIRILGQKVIIEEQLRDTNGEIKKVKKELTFEGERKS
jgi:Tfp pilus assembly protein PilP